MPEDSKLPVSVEVKKEGGWKPFARNINNRAFAPKPKFEGDCDDLKGYIFDCSDPRQADMFV
jgi:hypothetical protein